MTRPTRGFLGRHPRDPRLPPGQYDTGRDWPVLTAEPTPRITPESWAITVDGRVSSATTWSWEEAHRLPPSEYRGAVHCVTTGPSSTPGSPASVWTPCSRRPAHCRGRLRDGHLEDGLHDQPGPADVTAGKAWVVWDLDGRPMPIEHGGPARPLVPHLYFWKSAEGVTRLTVMARDQPGFWEQNGYHDRGDPWREQRYQGD